MVIDVNPTADEMRALHDELKAYEENMTSYLSSLAGQNDANYDALSDAAIQLNVQILNLSTLQLQLAATNAGAAIDAINAAVSNLNVAIAAKDTIATDLGFAQSTVSFVTALLSGNPSTIISTGNTLISKLKTA